MAARTAVIRVEPDLAEAYNSAPAQEQARLKAVLRTELRLVRKPTASRLSKKESELFFKINDCLSDERQDRYDTLTKKRLDGELSDAEYAELGELIKEIERIWARRLRAVADLARLRKVTPETIIKQLELSPSAQIS
ncbi:MAG: hypothetical protein SF097_12080 [Acidobacteriota bacterium]|nr:hypothetical protein [Acidobacteriota bacterium]